MTPEQLEKEAEIIGEIFCLPNRDHHLPCPMVDYILASLRSVHDAALETAANELTTLEGDCFGDDELVVLRACVAHIHALKLTQEGL